MLGFPRLLGALLLLAPSTPVTPFVLNDDALEPVAHQVSTIRGLSPMSAVPVDFLDRDALNDSLRKSVEWTYPEDERLARQQVLVFLRLFDPGHDQLDVVQALVPDQVVGTYDEQDKRIHLLGPEDTPSARVRVTFAHEFVHALQDQQYDLARLRAKPSVNADQSLAVQAVIEGDAILAQQLWTTTNLTPAEIATLTPPRIDPPSPLPAVTRAEQRFPYVYGPRLAIEAYRRWGGYGGVAHLLSEPPASTAEVLHPDRYFTGPQPVEVDLSEVPQRLGPGWEALKTNVPGELLLRALLEQYVPTNRAIEGASGWAGGRWILLRGSGRLALGIKMLWDTDDKASAFFQMYSDGLLNQPSSQLTQAETGPDSLTVAEPGWAVTMRQRGDVVTAAYADDPLLAATVLSALEL